METNTIHLLRFPLPSPIPFVWSFLRVSPLRLSLPKPITSCLPPLPPSSAPLPFPFLFRVTSDRTVSFSLSTLRVLFCLVPFPYLFLVYPLLLSYCFCASRPLWVDHTLSVLHDLFCLLFLFWFPTPRHSFTLSLRPRPVCLTLAQPFRVLPVCLPSLFSHGTQRT